MRSLSDISVSDESPKGADPADSGDAASPVGNPDRQVVGDADNADPQQILTATLRTAVERHGERAVLLCSFQKEESVLIDELLRIGVGSTPVRVVTIDTGVLFPETLATWKRFEERFGIVVEVEDASNPERPWTGPEHCCSVAKVAALSRALEDAGAWITGIRREQGPTRAQAQPVEEDLARGMPKYNPLSHWSDRDIWRRIHERDLPYHPLHDRGYDSIGCAPCTNPGSGRDGRWAGTEKTECGLHLDPATTASATASGESSR